MDRLMDRPPTAPTLVALHHLTHPQLLQLRLLVALDGAVEGPVVELLLGGPAAPHAAAAALPPAAPLLIYRCSAGGRRQLHLHIPTVIPTVLASGRHHGSSAYGSYWGCGMRGVEDTNNTQLLQGLALVTIVATHRGLISPLLLTLLIISLS